MTTLRSLIAELGFQVDTTPADRFNAAVNKVKNTAGQLNQLQFNTFNKRLKKAFKVAGGIVAAGIGAGIVTALKFADVEQALSQLQLQFKDSFKPLTDEVDRILADPTFGKLTTELDLLNAAAAAIGEGIDPKAIIRNLENILGFSTQFRQDITTGIAPFIDFIKSGNLDILLKSGKISAEQAQFLQKAGIGPEREAVQARIIRLEDLFSDISPDIKKSLEKLIEGGALSQKRLASSFDALTLEIGKKTLPAFQKLTEDGLIPFIDTVTKFVKGDRAAFVPEKLSPEEAKKQAIGETEDVASVRQFLLTLPSLFTLSIERANKAAKNIEKRNFSGLPIIGNNQSNTTTDQSNTTTNEINTTIIVQPGGTADETTIKTVVRGEFGRILGRIVQQSKKNRLTRGSGEAP